MDKRIIGLVGLVAERDQILGDLLELALAYGHLVGTGSDPDTEETIKRMFGRKLELLIDEVEDLDDLVEDLDDLKVSDGFCDSDCLTCCEEDSDDCCDDDSDGCCCD